MNYTPLCVAIGFAFAVLSNPARADINVPLGGPPISAAPSTARPVPVEVEVVRGESVRIPLKAEGLGRGSVGFVLRSRPRHGILGQVSRVNEHAATIQYTASAGGVATQDRFRYALQFLTGSPAGDAEVQIRIVEPLPALIFPDELDFGMVFAGDLVGLPVRITNTGKQRISGSLEVPQGWIWEGNKQFDLGPGQSLEATVGAPTVQDGRQEGMVRIMGDHPGGILLKAIVAPTWVVDRREIVLSADKARTGTFQVANVTDEPREIDFKSTMQLGLSGPVNVGIDDPESFTINAPDFSINGGETQLTLVSGGWSQTLRVVAPPLPASIEVLDSSGPWVAERSRQRWFLELGVQNSGGIAVTLRAESMTEGVSVATPSFMLESGKSSTLRFETQMEATRAAPEAVKVRLVDSNGKVHLEETIAINVVDQEPSPVSVPIVAPRPVVEQRDTTAAVPVTSEFVQPLPETETPALPESRFDLDNISDPSLGDLDPSPQWIPPGAPEVELIKGGKRANLTWPKQEPAPSGWSIELQYFDGQADPRPRLRWWPLEGLKFTEAGGRVSTTLTDLQPGTEYLLRLRAITESGQLGYPSEQFSIRTVAPDPIRIPWFWLLIIFGGGVWIFLKWKERSQT